jgi:hypothetical protein
MSYKDKNDVHGPSQTSHSAQIGVFGKKNGIGKKMFIKMFILVFMRLHHCKKK